MKPQLPNRLVQLPTSDWIIVDTIIGVKLTDTKVQVIIMTSSQPMALFEYETGSYQHACDLRNELAEFINWQIQRQYDVQVDADEDDPY